jgi:hypothetical protein
VPHPPQSTRARSSIIVKVRRGERAVNHLVPVKFEEAGIREVQDLETWILAKPEVLGEPLLVLDDEFNAFEGAKDRLDILCLDQQAHIVVVELKRTDTAGHADLQSLRYAAMVQPYTLDYAAGILSRSRQREGQDLSPADAKRKILEFLEESGAEDVPSELTTEPRIIIASPGFSEQILTTADYLKKHGIDITCVSLSAYSLGEGHFILVPRTEFPVRQLQNFQRELHAKEEAVQSARRAAVDRAYWEDRAGKESMRVVDSLFKILSESDDSVQPSFSLGYIRPRIGSGHSWPIWIHPEKKPLRVDVELADSQKATEWKGKLELAGLEADSTRPEVVRFRLTPDTLERNAGIVKGFLKEASTGD